MGAQRLNGADRFVHTIRSSRAVSLDKRVNSEVDTALRATSSVTEVISFSVRINSDQAFKASLSRGV